MPISTVDPVTEAALDFISVGWFLARICVKDDSPAASTFTIISACGTTDRNGLASLKSQMQELQASRDPEHVTYVLQWIDRSLRKSSLLKPVSGSFRSCATQKRRRRRLDD